MTSVLQYRVHITKKNLYLFVNVKEKTPINTVTYITLRHLQLHLLHCHKHFDVENLMKWRKIAHENRPKRFYSAQGNIEVISSFNFDIDTNSDQGQGCNNCMAF